MYGPISQRIILSTFIRFHAKIFILTVWCLSVVLLWDRVWQYEPRLGWNSPGNPGRIWTHDPSAFPSQMLGLQHVSPWAGQCWVLMSAFKVGIECAFERGMDSHIVLTQLHPHQVCVLQAHTHRPYTNFPSQILAPCTFSALCSTAVTMVRTPIQHGKYSINNQSLASSTAVKYI